MMFSSNLIRSVLLVGSLLPAARSAILDVVVGGPGGLKYDPEFVTAAVGDSVRFVFMQKNHTASQSSFDNPCVPLPGGFDSGYIPVADDVTEGFPVAVLPIVNTDPIWVYCKQGAHCRNGMVFAVNPGDRFSAFKAAAGGAAAPSGSGSASTTATSTSSAPSASVSATGTVHRVIVGGGGLTFDPSNIAAQPGDTITFEFRAKNHTVTASSFDAPCVPLSQSTPSEIGWDSGYVPVAEGTTTFPTYSVQVNDTRPIWAYCAQGNHCGSGMVFSANAVESGPRNFQAFQDLAKQINGTGGGSGSPYGGAAVSTRSSVVSTAAAALIALFISTIVL